MIRAPTRLWLLAAAAVACERAERTPPVKLAPADAPPSAFPDCSPTYAPTPDRDPTPMCRVPAGGGTLGLPPGAPRASEFPQRAVTIAADFYLDKYEVTNEQYARFLNAIGCPTAKPYCPERPLITRSSGSVEELPAGGPAWVAAPGLERVPFDHAPFAAAIRYCEWAGKRLPTSDEWEYAGRLHPPSGKLRLYPWGDVFERGKGNCHDSFCFDAFPGKAPVGSMPGDISPLGLADMFGNAREATRSCVGTDERCAVNRGIDFQAPDHPLSYFVDVPVEHGFRCGRDVTR